ncbi:MAG: rubrerythrin family protein [Deltaproteobacteria bacterium]|nr:rubrerythrin family protein [Deltaproteobacteria bacterium]MBN2688348.1 rubrerythrin family protein [Deltaproteobacteria bacterium]
MHEKIREALHEVYTGEAKAALRLKVYAKKAEEEGYPQMAKLFRVISFSEEIHGALALRVLKEIGTTEQNLAESFESEVGVAHAAYDIFLTLAYELGEKGAAWLFTQNRDVEEVHAALYKKALNDIIGDRVTTYYVCSMCGYVADGFLPEECPVCGATKDKFVHFD